ncbi:GDSL family lipase [Variovorax paradoxus]|nr:GDSL-type esterase/lipase family protein [Variovorax paradoxus]MBT2299306.1 GDSL family lipase [Variovorax paradoxus]
MNRRNLLGLLLAASSTALVFGACGKRTPVAAALKPGATVLALGDSLTAGHGAGPDDAWPSKLSQLTGWTVVNEGLNGDTSLGALQRLEGLLAANRYDAILVGIGGNDMLRGMSSQATIDNLAAIVRQARAHTSHVGVIATPAPEPMRAAIGSLSDAVFYAEVAKAEQALLIPNVYARVLSDAALRSDRIHANAQGYAQVAQQLAQQLQAAGWR